MHLLLVQGEWNVINSLGRRHRQRLCAGITASFYLSFSEIFIRFAYCLRQILGVDEPCNIHSSWLLTPSTPAVPNCCCSVGSAPYWSNPLFLIFDIGRARAPDEEVQRGVKCGYYDDKLVVRDIKF